MWLRGVLGSDFGAGWGLDFLGVIMGWSGGVFWGDLGDLRAVGGWLGCFLG